MLFNSYVFMFAFLPICLCGYFGLHRIARAQWAQGFLLVMSLVFYGYFHLYYFYIICFSILANFELSRCFYLVQGKSGRRVVLGIGLACNLGLLFYFKYFDFFLSNMNVAFHTQFTLRHILLPLGISFFTFQQVSFLIDSYRQEMKAYSFLEYALFVLS